MADKRKQIIDAALDTFYARGFHATGVDLLMEQAKVSKRTLYKYFRSKDELIVAVLAQNTVVTLNTLQAATEAYDGSAKEKILAIFDIEEEIFCSPTFSGCLASNALAEFSGKNDQIEAEYRKFKVAIEDFIHGLCLEANIDDAAVFAKKISLILEGTISYAHMHDEPTVAQDAKQIVACLIDAA